MAKFHIEKKISKKTWYFTGSQKNFLEWRTKHMFFPRVVILETTAECNARCTFCPHSSMPRAGKRMSDSLLDKILKELQEIPPYVDFLIGPVKMCEPLLEPRIWDIISRVQSEIKNAKITLASNLSLLNERHIEKLIRISIMNSMNISLNDYRPDAYKKIMGLDFSRTVANIKKLHELKERGKLNFRIVISRVADGTEHDSLFLKWCHEKFPLFPAAVAPRIDWLGGVESNLKYKVPNIGCPNWTTMSITYSGIVNLCCCDYKNDYIYGDANKQHILEIYNNTAYRNFRENVLSRLEVEPCRRCVSIAEPPLKYEDIQ